MFSLWNHLAVASKTMFIRYFCVATLRSCVSHPPPPPPAPHHQTHCLYVQLSTSSVWLSALPHTHTTRNRKIFSEQGWNRVRLGIDANLALIPQVESIPWNRCQVSKIFKNSASGLAQEFKNVEVPTLLTADLIEKKLKIIVFFLSQRQLLFIWKYKRLKKIISLILFFI